MHRVSFSFLNKPYKVSKRYFSTSSINTSQNFSNKYVTDCYKRFFHLSKFEKAINLSLKLENAKWIPNAQQIDYLVSILADKDDSKVTGPCLLNILTVITTKKLQVSSHTIRRLKWEFGRSKDLLLKESAYQLLYGKDKRRKNFLPTKFLDELNEHIQVSDMMIGLLASQEIDRAYARYVNLKEGGALADAAANLPFNELVKQLLVSQDSLEEALEVYHDATQYGGVVREDALLLLLDRGVSYHNIDIVKCIWDRISTPEIIPDKLLLKMLQVTGEHGASTVEYSESMATEYVSRKRMIYESTISVPFASSIIDAIARTSNSLFRTLKVLDTMYYLQPKLSVRDLPILAESVAGFVTSADKVDTLFSEVSTFCSKKSDSFRTLVMNLVLTSTRTYRTPSSMFYLYRKLERDSFIPNNETLQQLIFGAYRLGNSKKLSYLIYKECVEKHDIEPTRLVFETLIRNSMTGKSFDSLFYFLNEMRVHRVKMREHINRSISKRFEKAGDARYKELFSNKTSVDESLKMHADFISDEKLALTSSTGKGKKELPYNYSKDVKNCHDFVNGWNRVYI